MKDGEVNVYGILGRSVKDLLVVDTDSRPFAKLVQRSAEVEDAPSEVSGVSRKPRKSAAARPTIPESPRARETSSKARGKQRRPSPKPSISDKLRKIKPKSPKIEIPEHYYQHFSPRESPPGNSPGVETPTCPSPTPLDQRPNFTSPDIKSTYHHVDTPYPRDGSEQDQPKVFGGRVPVNQPTSKTTSPASGLLPDKYFWLTSQPPLRSPMEARLPEVYPPASPAVTTPVPSSLVNIHPKGSGGSRSPYFSKTRAGTDDKSESDTSEGSARHHKSTISKSAAQSQNAVPPRPASPKSRNASRSGRPVESRPSEASKPNFSQIEERLAALARRPGSALDSTRPEAEGHRQGRPRSRKSSIANQATPTVGTSHPADERLGSASCKEVPFMASPGIFMDAIERPQSDILKNRENNPSRNGARPGSTRPDAWAGAPSESRPSARKGSLPSQSRAGSTTWINRDAEPHIEPDETRTLLWSELSKMVGEVVHQPLARDESRGRRVDASRIPVSDTTSTRKVPPPEIGGSHSVPRTAQRLASQDRENQRPIRTILAPDVPNASSAPYNPDDEIVAEIIFHHQNRQGHGQTDNQGQPVRNIPSSQTVPRSAHKSMSPQLKGDDAAQMKTSPSMSEKGRLFYDSFGEIKVYKAPSPPDKKPHTGSGASCPSMDGASVHTEVTPKCSPATPSLHVFEPKTPKAMRLGPDLGIIMTSASDPLSSGELPSLDNLVDELASIGIPRAKSASW